MHFTSFEDGDALAQWLANHVASLLSRAIIRKGRASLAVSGGSTPKKFFRALSGQEIEWNKVWITLVDERMVAPTSIRSNQRMVTIELLQDKAASAHFVPIYNDGTGYENANDLAPALLSLLPLDVTVLGMGTDGHTASLFPGGDNLAEATNDDTRSVIVGMKAKDIEEPRVTLTLPVLTASETIILHIEGKEKRAVLEEANETLDPAKLPISFVLKKSPELRVVWAP